jgi:predicted acylesterase/phospholipase RssA
MQPSAFSHPTQECDIIMKGGITSGVVYPLAVVELAKTYRLRNIGGTSAGAIAAALAAAAEYGRSHPRGGFPKLAELPEFLADHLKLLFQPSSKTRPPFSLLLTWISPGKEADDGREPGKLARALAFLKKLALSALKLARFHPIAFLLGALLGIALFWLVADYPSEGQLITPRAMTLRVLFALFWGLLVALLVFAWRAVKAIQSNAFGMCSGMPAHEPSRRNSPPALTPWLAGLLDQVAGKTGAPLTFGDLWGPGDREAQEEDPRLRAINLEVMTTNLTYGWPVRLPTRSRELFFHPKELRGFFPEDVVGWMEDHPFPPRNERERRHIQRIVTETPFRPMPAPADLPVVVAARMSLSFPVLISAVPLYAVDWTPREDESDEDNEPAAPDPAPELAPCWFSDGGISSNFPVHFFDGLLPVRPVFGINLRPLKKGQEPDPDEGENVWFPSRAGEAVLPVWTPITSLFGFLGTIVRTMQNWSDNTQMRLPGYRDRVAHIYLSEQEGGMNLSMPRRRVERLTRRGRIAGQKVQTLDWDGHRWTRYRSAVAQLEERLDQMEEVYSGGFDRFLEAHDSKKGRYQRPDAWKKYAMESTTALMDAVRSWRAHPKYRLGDKPPKPEPELRISPRR